MMLSVRSLKIVKSGPKKNKNSQPCVCGGRVVNASDESILEESAFKCSIYFSILERKCVSVCVREISDVSTDRSLRDGTLVQLLSLLFFISPTVSPSLTH